MIAENVVSKALTSYVLVHVLLFVTSVVCEVTVCEKENGEGFLSFGESQCTQR